MSPHLITQQELNNLVRDLNLSYTLLELLASQLQGWDVLQKGVKVTSYGRRQHDFEKYFLSSEDVCCNDADGLFGALGHVHKPEEWQLFIDLSKVSLKAVFLHNNNAYPSVPLTYSVHMKESHEGMCTLLICIDYDRNKWKMCRNLKELGLLLVMQQGYTTYCCFLCEWNSHDKKHHHIRTDWPLRHSLTPGKMNIFCEPLVNPQDVYLPPLHMKLGLMKIFFKAQDREGQAFAYWRNNFPKLNEAAFYNGLLKER